jgi:hypothetical protein
MRRTSLLACLTGTTAGLAAVLVLTTGSDSVAQGSAPDAADARAAFSILARPARRGDVLPPAVRRQFEPVAAAKGLDLDAARALAPMGRGYVWALPGPKNVCIAIPDPVDGFGIGCADASDAAAGKLWVGLYGMPGGRTGDARVAFLLPDRIDGVIAVAGDGTRRKLAVSGNVAVADLTDSDHVELFDGASSSSVDVPGTPPDLVSD